jgi:AcrR family transcriptional regulator
VSHFSRSAELLWGPREQPARGPKRSLSLDAVVDAAIAVADADGIEALSMRRVARELGVGTMSLYRYVPGKAELLDLMLDRVSDPAEQVAQAHGQNWRDVLVIVARGVRQIYLSHSWLLRVNWSRPVMGPNTLAGLELHISGLHDLALTDQEKVSVMLLIDSYVTGMARNEILAASAAEATGVSDEQFWAEQSPVLERAMSTGNYPALARLADDAFELGWDETFEFGLERVLDGVAALIESRG